MIYTSWHLNKSLTAPSILARSGNSLLHWNQHKILLLIVYKNIQKIKDQKNVLYLALQNLKIQIQVIQQIPRIIYDPGWNFELVLMTKFNFYADKN